ncbi:MAG: hypothetical protein U0L15_10250, partial [Oscillospiraceae bacterium]|nr:hypothetical protein [Oscillospiraceae bacterium]
MEKKLHCGDLFKRVLSLAMALVMLLSFAPVPHAHAADGTTVYLKPSSNWLEANARFAIYYWTGSGDAWVDMSDADEDGYYEGTVPSDCTGLIFVRLNPDTTKNNWNEGTKWNQSADLELPT